MSTGTTSLKKLDLSTNKIISSTYKRFHFPEFLQTKQWVAQGADQSHQSAASAQKNAIDPKERD
jgi:hypothetical protein